MVVVGTVGPFNEGTDYVEGWKLADKLGVPMVDEHYYQTPGWFLNNQDSTINTTVRKRQKYTWANMRLISRDEKRISKLH